jgi:hypothetical protein
LNKLVEKETNDKQNNLKAMAINISRPVLKYTHWKTMKN